MDAMTSVIKYLAWKKKYKLQLLNKDFKDIIFPRTVKNLSFKGKSHFENSELFANLVLKSKKVEKLKLLEVSITLETMNKILKVFD